MNIKDHIEAGHYPTDDKGRALVPMRREEVATILATDAPGTNPIIGMFRVANGGETAVHLWTASGTVFRNSQSKSDLLPPPRKVKVTARLRRSTDGSWGIVRISRDGEGVALIPVGATVELTGEYEEPWP